MEIDFERLRIAWQGCRRVRRPGQPHLGTGQQRSHRCAMLCFRGGVGRRHTDNGLTEVGPGCCHWARPPWRLACDQDPSKPLDLNVIPFDLVDVRGRALDPAAVALPAEVLTVVDANLARAISDHVINLAADGTMSGPQALTARAAAETMFSGWLQRLSLDSVALDSAKSSWDGVIAYIDTHLHSLPSVAELAARWGYSRNHFSREFRRRVGLSPQQYVVRARFAVAEALLTETTLGVGKIAGRLGYASVYVFSQAFARHTGLSPTAWRRRVLAGRQPNVVNSSRESDPDLSRGRGAGFSP